MKILITGTSGFIGFHVAKKLLERGDIVVGIDNENDYYDVNLKIQRRDMLLKFKNFSFYNFSIHETDNVDIVFDKEKPQRVCNLAAQAGVRYSLKNPRAYVESNLVGFFNILDASYRNNVENFVYASSSSVYGTNTRQPFSVSDKTDTPLAIYAATKKSNELMAHAYSHPFGFPTTGLRFFTVYGPYGRPDMMLMTFASKILKGEPIDVYNFGKMKRDFTYIDDIVDGVIRSIDRISPYEIFNLGSDSPVDLEYMIELLEQALGVAAIRHNMPIQVGDVPATWADIGHTRDVLGWSPTTRVEEGVQQTISWYKEYFHNL